MSLPKKDKEVHLKDLTQLITGISLFNKECGKGGEGIDNIPPFLKGELDSMAEKLSKESHALTEYSELLIELIEKVGDSWKGQDELSEASVQHSYYTEALINISQLHGFVKIILSDALRARQQVSNLESKFQGHIESLKECVKAKTAVPTEQVFPHFASLATLWQSFQDEMFYVTFRSDVMNTLLGFGKMSKGNLDGIAKDEDITGTLKDTWEKAKQKAESNQETIDLTANIENAADIKTMTNAKERIDPESVAPLRVIFKEDTPNFNSLVLQFNGYCAWTIAARDKMLLPGKVSVGVLEYREQYFTFINKEAAKDFAKDPDGYIGKVVEHAKKAPELINLLNMHSHFAAITPYHSSKGDARLRVHNVSKRDNGIQTELHPVETNIIKDYDWNEWELRRKAIKLTNLRQKKTQSMQTDLSHFRRDNSSQHYPPKDQSVNTKKDGKSKVPKRQNFISGLRGEKKKVQVVDLTLEVEKDALF